MPDRKHAQSGRKLLQPDLAKNANSSSDLENLAGKAADWKDMNEERPASSRPFRCIRRQEILLAILLNPGRSETGKTVTIDRLLPGEKFLDG